MMRKPLNHRIETAVHEVQSGHTWMAMWSSALNNVLMNSLLKQHETDEDWMLSNLSFEDLINSVFMIQYRSEATVKD